MCVVDVSVPVLEWAQSRSRRGDAEMAARFPHWSEWLARKRKPELTELEEVAEFLHIPLAYFFRPEPPVEKIPIPDFRRAFGEAPEPSSELLDTISLNQRRQARREFQLARSGEAETLALVGRGHGMRVAQAADEIMVALDYDVDARADLGSAEAARSHLAEAFEEIGGLVVINGTVESETHRPLDALEFSGFTLHSMIAPLVFVNAADSKTAQVLALLNEIAHVWRGECGLSIAADPLHGQETLLERWCERVAAAIAVPMGDLLKNFRPDAELAEELDRLAQRYLCSTLVILLRLREAGLLRLHGFNKIYQTEAARQEAELALRETVKLLRTPDNTWRLVDAVGRV